MLASGTAVIDRKTGKFHHIPDNAVIVAPFYMMKDYGDKLRARHAVIRRTYCPQLKHVRFAFADWFPTAGVFDGHQKAEVDFGDLRSGEYSTIKLDCYPHFGYKYMNSSQDQKLTDVFYEFDICGKQSDIVVDFDEDIERPSFKWIDDLAHMTTNVPLEDRFSYGLRHEQYGVVYKGRRLNGTSYAFLFGTWAVLLDDDLKYDSLVVLEGADSATLCVNAVIHTVNPYMVKVKTLMG